MRNLILLWFCLLSCSSSSIKGKSLIICEDMFRPFVNEFLKQSKNHNTKLDHFEVLQIRFSERIDGFGFNGWAANAFGSKRLILINPFTWSRFDYNKKLLLIAHEMGHTLLHRAHEETGKDSIMYPSATSFLARAFLIDRKYYWKELFSVRDNLPFIPDQVRDVDEIITRYAP